jgi:hypothetical protein
MDPEALLIVEEMSYEHRAGRRANQRDMMRLPGPPVAAPAPVD